MRHSLPLGLLSLAACLGEPTMPPEVDTPGSGVVRVVTTTVGIGTDPDGYQMILGADTSSIGAVDTAYVSWAADTTIWFYLKDIDGACRIHEPWAWGASTTVLADDTTEVAFQVDCGIVTVYTSHPTLGPAFVDFEIVTGRTSGYTTNYKYLDAWDFSPDGTKIAASVYLGDNRSRLYLLGRTLGDTIRVETSAPRNDYPAWSPDGTMIRFVSGSDSAGFEMLAVPPTGIGPAPVPGVPGHRWGVRWSRTGDRIAYVTGAMTQLVVANADGSGAETVATGSYSWVSGPDWSPSGDSIVYNAPILIDSGTIVPLYLVRTDGSTPTQLTHPGPNGFDFSPSWSRDGRYIAYIHQANNSINDRVIVVLDLQDGSTQTFTWQYPIFSLQWQP